MLAEKKKKLRKNQRDKCSYCADITSCLQVSTPSVRLDLLTCRCPRTQRSSWRCVRVRLQNFFLARPNDGHVPLHLRRCRSSGYAPAGRSQGSAAAPETAPLTPSWSPHPFFPSIPRHQRPSPPLRAGCHMDVTVVVTMAVELRRD